MDQPFEFIKNVPEKAITYVIAFLCFIIIGSIIINVYSNIFGKNKKKHRL